MKHRKSIRLKNYNYSQGGLYFITICSHQRHKLFGDVIEGKMVLNAFGEIVEDEWLKTATIRENVQLDQYVIMPNHLHGIIAIIDEIKGIGASGVGAYGDTPLQEQNQFKSPSKTIGAIIRGFKSSVTKQINILRQMPGVPVWQRNYYDHIIRDESDLSRIQKYIYENPVNWQDDRYHL